MTQEFPARVEELTPEFLSTILSKKTPVEVQKLEIVSTKMAGEGVASTADRVLLSLDYAPGSPEGLPRRMVLKTMLVAPHAPATMYETEVRFYDEIREELDLEAPQVFGSHFAPQSGHFGLLLEDLTERRAHFPNATTPTSLPEVRSLLDQLASLHARFWQSPRLSTEFHWVPTPIEGGMADLFNEHGYEIIQSQLDQYSFKRELIEPLGRSLKELWECLTRVRQEQSSLPPTLLHGDPHIGNTYLLPGERGGLLDWQLLTRGHFAHDVAYLLNTALSPEARREHQPTLLEYYLDRLQGHGVVDVPDPAEAWLHCRRASLWGLVIGWLITPPQNYGIPITKENVRRTASAVRDLKTLDVI